MSHPAGTGALPYDVTATLALWAGEHWSADQATVFLKKCSVPIRLDDPRVRTTFDSLNSTIHAYNQTTYSQLAQYILPRLDWTTVRLVQQQGDEFQLPPKRSVVALLSVSYNLFKASYNRTPSYDEIDTTLKHFIPEDEVTRADIVCVVERLGDCGLWGNSTTESIGRVNVIGIKGLMGGYFEDDVDRLAELQHIFGAHRLPAVVIGVFAERRSQYTVLFGSEADRSIDVPIHTKLAAQEIEKYVSKIYNCDEDNPTNARIYLELNGHRIEHIDNPDALPEMESIPQMVKTMRRRSMGDTRSIFDKHGNLSGMQPMTAAPVDKFLEIEVKMCQSIEKDESLLKRLHTQVVNVLLDCYNIDKTHLRASGIIFANRFHRVARIGLVMNWKSSEISLLDSHVCNSSQIRLGKVAADARYVQGKPAFLY